MDMLLAVASESRTTAMSLPEREAVSGGSWEVETCRMYRVRILAWNLCRARVGVAVRCLRSFSGGKDRMRLRCTQIVITLTQHLT
jgi:hypothetical protein